MNNARRLKRCGIGAHGATPLRRTIVTIDAGNDQWVASSESWRWSRVYQWFSIGRNTEHWVIEPR